MFNDDNFQINDNEVETIGHKFGLYTAIFTARIYKEAKATDQVIQYFGRAKTIKNAIKKCKKTMIKDLNSE